MAKYTVKKGDSGIKIAKLYGISYDSLLAANPGVSSITPGISLRVPTNLEGAPPGVSPSDRPYIPQPFIPRPGATPPVYTPPPYVPPPPASGDYGPKGYPKEPGTQLPYTSPPPPYIPPPPPREPFRPSGYFGADGQQPVSLPPREPSRPGTQYQTPVVTYTGAGRQPIPQPQPTRQGLITAPFQIGQAIAPTLAPRIQGFLDRLFGRMRQPAFPLDTGLRRPGEPTAGARFDPLYTQPQIAAGLQDVGASLNRLRGAAGTLPESEFAEGFPRGSLTAPGPGSLLTGAAAALGAGTGIGMPPMQTGEETVQDDFGNLWYRMEMGEGRSDRMFQYAWDESSTNDDFLDQRADHVKQSLARGDKPQIILESDRSRMGFTADEMAFMGYYWDEEKGHWIYGEIIEGPPQTYDAAQGYGGYYNYPSRGYRGGGGGTYSYPSYLPREQGQYPQSFVGQEQRGRVPQVDQNRAARFGAVTWRI